MTPVGRAVATWFGRVPTRLAGGRTAGVPIASSQLQANSGIAGHGQNSLC